jgi:hypothetical protein
MQRKQSEKTGKSAMATTPYRDSAQIIAFPSGGRRSVTGYKSQFRAIVEFQPKQLPVADYDAWYHQEAVEDEKTPVN